MGLLRFVYDISRNKNLIHLFEKSLDFMEKNYKGIISIPYLNEDAFLKIMNALIKREIQIQNFHLFEAYFESNDEVIKKVYIQYQYCNNWQLSAWGFAPQALLSLLKRNRFKFCIKI